jgi:hypothetical protein
MGKLFCPHSLATYVYVIIGTEDVVAIVGVVAIAARCCVIDSATCSNAVYVTLEAMDFTFFGKQKSKN